MPLYTNLASLSQTAASNAADGSVDAPSTIDQQTNLLASFIAQLRDGNGFATGVSNVGQCRLTKSGSNLLLSPFNGNGLTINGVVCKIPAAGITLAPTALSVGTTYYIYATASGTAVNALEASTTTHATDSTTGVEIKSGDATRTLVGMARIITGPAWSDTTAQRFVVSWFNRRPISLQAVLSASQGNAGTSYSVLLAGLLLEVLSWASDQVSGTFQGGLTNNVANAVSQTAIFIDGAAAESFSATGAYISAAAQPVYCSVNNNQLSEGYHSLQVYALQNVASTATYIGGGSSAVRCVHSATILG
jgi:hypothetical protein